jgi:spore germination protein YaaH
MKLILTLLLVAVCCLTSFSQETTSIHKLHSLQFGITDEQPSKFDPSGKDIIPLQFEKSELTKNVFGYLPDWEYPTSKQYLQYSLLTHIAAFDFVVSTTGSMTNPSGWPWTDVINLAHQNGVKVILCAVNFNGDEIHTIMTNQTSKQTFFNNVKSKILQYQLDGVNIDFEDLNTADRGTVVNTFMQDLTNFIHTELPGKEVSFAGPAVNWGGWQLAGLASACDYIFIMGYSFYGSWSTTTGACSPLTGGTYNITNTVNTQYGGIPPQKLILGIPYYGLKWKARTNQPHAVVQSYVSSTRFKDDVTNSLNYERIWAFDNQVPWYRWQISDTSWYQVWWDNDSSLGLKYNLADSKNYRGVGMWALGYDGSRMELWNELHRRYFVPVELLSFSATSNANNVLLNWTTATEINNKGFFIQRLDLFQKGLFNWVDVGFVNGYGSTTEKKYYTFVDNNVKPSRYKYRLIQVDFDGTKKEAVQTEVNVLLPENCVLEQNYPNPFNPSTKISYQISKQSSVTLKVFDVLGNEVATLVNEEKQPGSYEVEFGTKNVKLSSGGQYASGVYFYQLKAGSYTTTRKMIYIR